MIDWNTLMNVGRLCDQKGISLEEFDELPITEQHRLIDEYNKGFDDPAEEEADS